MDRPEVCTLKNRDFSSLLPSLEQASASPASHSHSRWREEEAGKPAQQPPRSFPSAMTVSHGLLADKEEVQAVGFPACQIVPQRRVRKVETQTDNGVVAVSTRDIKKGSQGTAFLCQLSSELGESLPAANSGES